MPAARYWRLVGLETYAGGDLELSELQLYGDAGRLDAATPIVCSSAPIAGVTAALQDNDLGTSCRYAGPAVRSGGFSFAWDFGLGNTVEALGLRIGAGDTEATFLAACTLEYSADGTQWIHFETFNRYDYPGSQQYTRPPAGGDSYYPKVALLLNLDGSNGSTTFTDRSESPKVVTPTGAARISTAQSKWGGGSLIISGLDSDLTIPDPLVETDVYTIESWVRLNATDAGGQYSHPIFGQGGAAGSTDQYFGIVFSDQPSPLRLRYFRGPNLGAGLDLIGTTAVTREEWAHCALTYDGLRIRGFLNGVMQFQADSAIGWKPTGSPFRIGRSVVVGYEQYRQALQGNLDDIRITKGVARYINNFTAPAMPFPTGTGGADGTVFVEPALCAPKPDRVIIAGSSAVPEYSAASAPKLQTARDIEFGGNYRVYGAVARKNTPANTPLKRRVRLHRSRDGILVRETWSKPDGSYEFRGVGGDYQYDVIAWDHEFQDFSTVANNQLAEVMP